MAHTSLAPPSRPMLRQLLARLFPVDTDFDAFLIDHFLPIKQRMTVGQERTARVNLLMELVDTERLWAVLIAHYPEAQLIGQSRDGALQSPAVRQRETLHGELTQREEMIDRYR